MDQERVILSGEDLKRLTVLERVTSGSMNFREGAEHLGMTERQLRRLRKKYNEKGAAGLIHGNRDRRPAHALNEEIQSRVVTLFAEKYHDSNYSHCAELLKEHDGIKLSRQSVSRILRGRGYESKRPKKRRPKKHTRRDRRTQAGMLWQTDATPYEWLGESVGKFALHAMIDDATGLVTGAWFTQNECSEGYIIAMQEGIKKYGVPMGLYSDKHTIFRSPNEKLSIEQELAGESISLSNFGKAMAELHIEHIKANTPQAKGRIERLWETLQDRLPVELRLMKVSTIQEANGALPVLIAKHNARFSVAPADMQTAYTPLDKEVNLEYVFARRERRKIGGGNAISYKNAIYVPVDTCANSFAAKVTVEVRETLSGEVIIWHEGRCVPLRKLNKRPSSTAKETHDTKGEKKPFKPNANHPWRRPFVPLKVESGGYEKPQFAQRTG